MALTDAKVKGLKAAEKRYMVSDGQGLSLDVLPSGKMTWLFKYRQNGKQEKVTLGRYPDLSLKDARARRADLATTVAKGKSPAKEKKLARAGLNLEPTLAELAEVYFREHIAKRYKNPADGRRYIDSEILVHKKLVKTKLRELTRMDIDDIISQKRNGDPKATPPVASAPASAQALLALLKRMFDFAIQRDQLEVNPALRVKTTFIARPRTRSLTVNELRSYLRTLYQADIRQQFKLALHLLMLTMVRKSELQLAEWREFDLEAGEWHIPSARTKTGAPHIVYLSTQAIGILRELKALAGDSALVIPGRLNSRKPYAHNAMNQVLAGIDFGLENFTIHDSRRTASTLLHGNGWPSDAIELALGHKIGGIRGTYNVASYAAERKQMLQWWGNYIDSIITESNVVEGNFRRA